VYIDEGCQGKAYAQTGTLVLTVSMLGMESENKDGDLSGPVFFVVSSRLVPDLQRAILILTIEAQSGRAGPDM
jgi:hypothetical protein